MKSKTRKQKELEYAEKYSHIPIDYEERLSWLYDHLHITEKKSKEIIDKRYNMLNSLEYLDLRIVLYENPEGTPRTRFRLINRENLCNMAISNQSFVHVYSITGKSDRLHMERLLSEQDLMTVNKLIYTPSIVTYTTFFKTPSYYNSVDTFLAEIGLNRHMVKPDWDNLGKKYSDMSNSNIWIDDNIVIEGTVKKMYSVLPRIEIDLKFLNMLYNIHDYRRMSRITQDTELKYFGGNT